MSYMPVTQLRRRRKKNSVVMNKKIVGNALLASVTFSLILLIPVLSRPVTAHASTLLALCTLLLFGGIIVGLSVRLLLKLSHWLRNRKYAMAEVESAKREMASGKQTGLMVIDTPRLQHSFFRGLEGVLAISAWAFLLYLMQPFITSIVWWQGYKLMVGKSFPLATIEGTLTMIESSVYFGIIVFLVLFSWSQYNYWRYGRLNRRRPKPNVQLTLPLDVVNEFTIVSRRR